MIYKYSDFLLENKFNQIINELFIINETGKWVDDKTYEWDLTKKDSVFKKLKIFLSELSKEKVKNYFYDFIEKVRKLPNSNKIIARYSVVFLIFVSLNYLTNDPPEGKEYLIPELKEIITSVEKSNIKKMNKASFEDAQKFVKAKEGGFTKNKKDKGNYVKTPYGRRLIGTNHGISAPVLADWMGKLPTMEDMINLTYEEALKIYKKNYWDAHNLSEYKDQMIATIIYDGAVNQGPTAMKEIVKEACKKQNISINSPYNIKDIDEINKIEQEILFNDIKKLRKDKYEKTKEADEFLDGWLNRLNSLNYE